MASMWRRAMLYLGLGPDDEYDDYDVVDEPIPARERPAGPPSRYPAGAPALRDERDREHAGRDDHDEVHARIGAALLSGGPCGAGAG